MRSPHIDRRRYCESLLMAKAVRAAVSLQRVPFRFSAHTRWYRESCPGVLAPVKAISESFSLRLPEAAFTKVRCTLEFCIRVLFQCPLGIVRNGNLKSRV